MKTIFILCCLITSLPTLALTIKIIGPCSKTPLKESHLKINDLKINLGNLTVNFLTQEKIPFSGSEYGISSINGSAVGDDAIEILSDTEMRAYGWCFSVNNILSDKMPNETFLASKNDTITWFYAYMTYDKGEWRNYCTPAYTVQNSKFCSQE